jgi:hypothetical protein
MRGFRCIPALPSRQTCQRVDIPYAGRHHQPNGWGNIAEPQANVSLIPNTALSSALSPIERQTNDSLRARKIQIQKNAHHAEDVQELNDTGVDSIGDHPQEKKRDDKDQPDPEARHKEKVDIASLKAGAVEISAKTATAAVKPHLDISA